MSRLGLPAMAKKKAGGSGEKKPRSTENWNMKPIIATLRGNAEFKDWLAEAAAYDRSNVAMFLERAAVRYAKEIGFPKAPPER